MGQDLSKERLCSVFDVVQILVKGFFSGNFREATKINYYGTIAAHFTLIGWKELIVACPYLSMRGHDPFFLYKRGFALTRTGIDNRYCAQGSQ